MLTRGPLAALVLCVIATTRGASPWLFVIFPAFALIGPPFLEKRIDIDADGLTVVPLLPLRRSQRFAFRCLGAFSPVTVPWYQYRYGRQGLWVRVPITSGPSYKLAGLFSQRHIDFSATFTAPGQASALTQAELVELLERYRSGHAPEPEPSAAASVESAPPGEDDGAPAWVREGRPFPPRSS